MKYTIEDLRNGKCAVINDGTLGQLRAVLHSAFPKDKRQIIGNYSFYSKNQFSNKEWTSEDTIPYNLPIQSVKDFLESEEKSDSLEIIPAISRRDYFAAIAMQGLLARIDHEMMAYYAELAVEAADALILELDKK